MKAVNKPSNTAGNPEIYSEVFCFFGKMDASGCLAAIDGKIFENTGLSPSLLIGQKFSETVFWQSSAGVAEKIQNLLSQAATGKKVKTETEFRIDSQNKAFIELSLIPQTDSQGNVAEIVFFAYDITKREKEISFHRLRSEHLLYAAESADIGLWFWDLKKDKLSATPQCFKLFNLSPHEEFTFEKFANALHPEDTERVVKTVRNCQLNNVPYETEYRVIRKDGSQDWLAAAGKTFYDEQNTPTVMTGMVRQITERRREAKKTEQILESERKAHERAEEANRSKDYFIAFVSHELRTPLNSILGWAKILLTKTVDDNTRQKALETIERSAKTQAKLIEDLVDTARVASGKLKLELRQLNLYDVLENSYQSQLPGAQSRQIKMSFKSDTTKAEVYGDPMRLQQIFNNILTNALKFTPADGDISINFETPGNQAVVTVTDTGQGISPELLPKIFNRFMQADPEESRDRTGLGLGLTIVKTLIEKQGGTVSASSEGIGKGAKFIVTLPLISRTVPEKSEFSSESETHKTVLAGKNLLIVEDDADSRLLLQLFLEEHGAIVTAAGSAAAAMKFLNNPKNEIPDFIISDIGLPGEDGFSFIKKVRKHKRKPLGKVPAIALSAFPSTENKTIAIEAGFNQYCEKPFETDCLLKEIGELLDDDVNS